MASLKDQLSEYCRELTVLLVEDDAATRARLAAECKGAFRELLLASNGSEGLEIFRTARPHVVLTDNWMPGMTGTTMIEEIRKLDAKVPVIFTTATMDTPLLVRAINLGISSILPKPVTRDALVQAFTLVVGTLETDHLQRKNLEQELALLAFREKYHEHQQEIAFRKELSIQENDFRFRTFGQPGTPRGEWAAQVLYHPRDIMCGDSYSLRRLPDGGLLLFLADAMGKGLSAALTTSLSVYTFNLQVDALPRGAPFDFKAFADGFTRSMARYLLEDEVLPLSLVLLPAHGTTLEAASFGMPPILVADPGPCALRCGNPPVSAYLEGVRIVRHDLGDAGALLFYTDGLNEAVTTDGSLYRDHLEADFAATAGRNQLWEAFQAKVKAPEDDLAALWLFRTDRPCLWEEHRSLESRVAQVEEASQEVEALLARTPLSAGGRYEFAIAVREALLNAFEHGSLEIHGRLKGRLLQEDAFIDYVLDHQARTHRKIHLELSLRAWGGSCLLAATVRDEGPGFTPPRAWMCEPDSLMLHGRGLKLIGKYTDAFHFNGKGNAITLLRICRGGSHAP